MSRGSKASQRVAVHALTAVALVISTLTVAGSAAADQRRDADTDTDSDTVERIALTDDAGAPTEAGLGGWDAWQASGSGSDRQADSTDDEDAPEVEEPALLTAATESETFYVLALTWDAASGVADDTCLFVRVLEGATWSEWLELDIEQGSDDIGGIAGTDPFVTSGATGVQVQVNTGGKLPAGLTLSLIPDNVSTDAPATTDVGDPAAIEPDDTIAVESEEEVAEDDWSEWTDDASGAAQTGRTGAGSGTAGSALSGSASMSVPAAVETLVSPQVNGSQPMVPVFANPGVRTRAQWGADESIMDWTRRYVDLRAAVVHHTAGTNNYTQGEVPAIIRGIYHYHAVTRGWGDIGYNFLVDRFGRAWEGRSGTLASPAGQMVIGGHAAPLNTHTLGISVMGTYTSQPASATVMGTLADVIAWQFSRAALDMATSTNLYAPGNGDAPEGALLPRIFGHRAVSATTCPGQILGQLPELRTAVQSRMPYLWYLRNDNRYPADVHLRYSRPGAQAYWGDWNGDGIDTPASREGNLIQIRNALSYGHPSYSYTFSRPGVQLLVGDWDGDGVDTFAIREGTRYSFFNDVEATTPDVVVRYGRPTDEVIVGDWDGDGIDTLAVRRDTTYYVTNSIADGPAEFTFQYGRPTDRVYVGDWNADGLDTLAVRRGNVYYFTNDLGRGSDYTRTFGRSTDHVVVGDWDGDGKDTFGIRRR